MFMQSLMIAVINISFLMCANVLLGGYLTLYLRLLCFAGHDNRCVVKGWGTFSAYGLLFFNRFGIDAAQVFYYKMVCASSTLLIMF